MTSSTQEQQGGEVIDSGGYGCIFSPQIQCKTQKASTSIIPSLSGRSRRRRSTTNKTQKISKIMLKSNAEDEYKQIQELSVILKNIPHVSDYFILDNIDLCEPVFRDGDLNNFNYKCDALTRKNYTQENIQGKLDDIRLLNIPNGGENLERVFTKYYASRSLVSKLNELLIDLLMNAILPMNALHVIHGDLKASNVVFDNKTKHVRIIDWGLSVIVNPPIDRVPHRFHRCTFQFNLPVGIVLLSKEFEDKYALFLGNHDTSFFGALAVPIKDKLFDFVVDYIYYWIVQEKVGPGHLIDFNTICSQLFDLTTTEINKQHTEHEFYEQFNKIINFSIHLI